MSDLRDAAAAATTVVARGLMTKVLLIGLAVLIVGLIALPLFVGGQNAAADACGDQVSGGVDVPVAQGPFSQEQQDIARTADQVATQMTMPGRAVLVILMTGFQESGVRNLDYGDRDSLGWLQQRPSQGWGTPEEVRDVAHASRRFYAALRGVSSWVTLPLNDAAQAVQRSGHPQAYAKHEPAGRALAAAVGADLERPGDPYGTGATDGNDPDLVDGCLVSDGPVNGVWPTERATICPDPTNGRGCITPRTAVLVQAIQASGLAYKSLSCWDPHAWNPSSDHPKGRACDLAYSSGFATGQALADGNAMANWAVVNAGKYGVSYVIWQGRIWTARTGIWGPYNGGGIYNPSSPSGGHYDHVHISVY